VDKLEHPNREYVRLSLLQLAALVASLGAQILIAQRIGPSAPLDSYFAITGFAATFVGGLASGAFYLIPGLLLGLNQTEARKSQLAGNGLVAVTLLGLVVSVLSVIIFLTTMVTPQKNFGIQHETLLVGLGWTGAFFSVTVAAWGAIGHSHGRTIAFTTLGILPYAAASSYLLSVTTPTVTGLAASQLIAAGLQAASLGLIYHKYWSLKGLNYQTITQIMGQLPLAGIGAFCFTAHSAIDAWIAPAIGQGVLSHQALAQRLVIALGAVLTAGPFMLAPSITAALIIDNRYRDTLKFCLRVGGILTSICLVASVATLSIGRCLITFTFERGAFGSDDTDAVVKNLSILLLGAGPMLSTTIIFRVFHNLSKYRQMVYLSFAWVLIYGMFAKFLSDWLGLITLSVAYAVAWWLIGISAFLILLRYLRAGPV
jgi:peptidoglycan biosynthesis protein MviN/MurJ (putative lipid II flippase)